MHVYLDLSVQVSEPNYHFHQYPVQTKPNQIMNNNVDSSDVITNTNDEERAIPYGYYSIAEIIAILNTMIDAAFSISTKDSS